MCALTWPSGVIGQELFPVVFVVVVFAFNLRLSPMVCGNYQILEKKSAKGSIPTLSNVPGVLRKDLGLPILFGGCCGSVESVVRTHRESDLRRRSQWLTKLGS